MMAVVHDLAEAQGTIQTSYWALRSPLARSPLTSPNSLSPVGDIAPREGIPKAEKRRLEAVRSYVPVCLCFTPH